MDLQYCKIGACRALLWIYNSVKSGITGICTILNNVSIPVVTSFDRDVKPIQRAILISFTFEVNLGVNVCNAV